MSITIMAEVWPLKMKSTDKLVLIALADSANDEESHTWIPVKSRLERNRAGRPKLDLIRKTGLGERAVQMAIKRLCEAGHITREEVSGKGCNYWVHPVGPEGETDPRTKCGAQEKRGASDSPTPAGGAGGPRTKCGETVNNPKQPSAGAGARASREAGSGSAIEGADPTGPATLRLKERDAEGEREAKIRAGIIARAREQGADKPAPWLDRVAFKVGVLASDDGPVGISVFTLPGEADSIRRFEHPLQRDARDWLGVPVRWVNVSQGTVDRG